MFSMHSEVHSVRRLSEADIEPLLAIRHEALVREPTAFSSSPASDRALDPEFLRNSLTSQAVLGAYQGDALVGMAGVYRRQTEKEGHKAVLWGMYVRPSHRGLGLGRALLAEAVRLARAMAGVSHLCLSVSDTATSAYRIYEAAGFRTWGVESASLLVGGTYVAVRHMVLDLRYPDSPERPALADRKRR